MCVQHKETENLKIILFTDLTNGTEISERFGHLAVVDVQETIMHPVSCKNLTIAALTLCDLILMMREDQILTACMDIDLFSKIFLRHNRALNMPARTSVAPR